MNKMKLRATITVEIEIPCGTKSKVTVGPIWTNENLDTLEDLIKNIKEEAMRVSLLVPMEM